MILFLKLVGAVLVYSLLDPVYDQSSAILDVIALAAIFGSVVTYNRIKAALAASEAAGKAWREERDAEIAHVQRITATMKEMADEKVVLVARLTALEAKPDLTRLEGLVADATDATKTHERNAGERTERLIAAVERISVGQQAAATELKGATP